jgi:stage II sporulation protein P
MFVTLLLSGSVYFMWTTAVSPVAVLAIAQAQPNGGGTAPAVRWPQWKDILGQGVPGLFTVTQPPVGKTVAPKLTTGQVFRGAILAFTGVDVQDMKSLLQKEIPILLSLKGSGLAVGAMSLPDFPKLDLKIFSGNGKNPLVGIYHTHTAESFISTSGHSHSPGGQRGDIVKVGDDLASYLDQQGIGTVHSDNIHDYPSFMKAYNLSEVTVRKMLSDNPSLQMLFDIHRDAEKRENVTATVNGVAVARIMIVVGQGQPDLVQPHWQQNQAFAKLIEAKMNERYPGLSRGIQLVDWRYNEHLHPRLLLLEVGCQENSLEEANRSIEMLGSILVDIIHENKES